MSDSKYITFKRDEYERWKASIDEGDIRFPEPLPDAVVIRRQDVFAAPALEAYANSILATVEALKVAGMAEDNRTKQLIEISDYFADQASESWLLKDRKLPD